MTVEELVRQILNLPDGVELDWLIPPDAVVYAASDHGGYKAEETCGTIGTSTFQGELPYDDEDGELFKHPEDLDNLKENYPEEYEELYGGPITAICIK